MFSFYEVGGCVRDEIMGLKSKDIDYVVVADEELLYKTTNPDEIFYVMQNYLEKQGYHIWLTTPECFTIRARFPDNHKHAGMTADFVLARKEEGYYPGTRRPIVKAGTLLDDLTRRDFTMNAIAKDKDGKYYDPFNGQMSIFWGVLATPLSSQTSFDEDPLRILRAIRFSITKGFSIPLEMQNLIYSYGYETKMRVVSEERIREELYKCFKFDSFKTMETLSYYKPLMTYIFKNTKLWLEPTNKK